MTPTGAGTCTITASQAGSANYAPASNVVRTVTIAQAPTSLRQQPASLVHSLLRLRVTYAAVLTSQVTGLPIAGQTIAFGASSSGPAACTGVTDGTGRASCTSPLWVVAGIVVGGSMTARYGVTANYLGSTTTTRSWSSERWRAPRWVAAVLLTHCGHQRVAPRLQRSYDRVRQTEPARAPAKTASEQF